MPLLMMSVEKLISGIGDSGIPGKLFIQEKISGR